MTIEVYDLYLKTTSKTDIIDLTPRVREEITKSSILNGVISLFVPGSTAALTTIEYESGAINDLRKAIEKIAPQEQFYEHNERWGDGNGYSHVRAAILGPSLSVPIADQGLALGTWQQIVLLDFDNRPRKRRIIMQIYGE